MIKKSEEQIAKELVEFGLVLLEPYKGVDYYHIMQYTVCKHTVKIRPSKLFSRGTGASCKECVPNISTSKKSDEDIGIDLAKYNLFAVSEYTSAKDTLVVENSECGHTWKISLDNLLTHGTGSICRVCNPTVGPMKRSTEEFSNEIAKYGLVVLSEYVNAHTKVLVKNISCNHEYEVYPNNILRNGAGSMCRECSPFDSLFEKEIYDFIKENYSGWVLLHDKTIITPKHLDIVLPDLGIAFELNGEYWHSESKRGNTYHLDKTNSVEALEFQLIHITDIQWNTKKDIIKSRILSLLNKSKKIMARKCNVKLLDLMPVDFLNTNHLQGAGAPTGINYGLFYREELVAVMTFKRTNLHMAEYELVRYCSKLNNNVIGGASKLLKAFELDYTNPTIMSYAARDWSKGGLYFSLGFSHIKNTEPGYHYFKGNDTFSRQKFQKSKLANLFPEIYKEDKTEKEIMLEAGYNRYYDSGNMVFIKHKNTERSE